MSGPQDQQTSVQYNLLKILPEQVNENWDLIKQSLGLAWPTPLSNEALAGILQSLLLGKLQAWGLVDIKSQDEMVWKALGTTAIVEDEITGVSKLHIYHICVLEGALELDVWKFIWVKFTEYAKALGCSKVSAITRHQRVVDIVESLGGDATTRLIELEV